MVLTALAGYLAPSLLGLAAAGLVAVGWAVPLLWLAILMLVITLVYVRNVYGGIAVLVTGAGVGAVAWYGSPQVQVGFAEAAAWFLLFGGLRAVRELGRVRRRQIRSGTQRLDSDADQLARLTGLPGWLWVALFTVVALGCLALGGWLLLGDVLTRAVAEFSA
jgi:hypothetical protein